MTRKQAAFAQKYAGASLVQDAPTPAVVYSQSAGVTLDSGYVIANRLLDNPYIGDRIAQHLLKHNSLSALARDLQTLRKCSKGVYHQGVKVADEVDGTTRLGAISLVLKAARVVEDADARPSVSYHYTHVEATNVERIAQALTKLYAPPSDTPPQYPNPVDESAKNV